MQTGKLSYPCRSCPDGLVTAPSRIRKQDYVCNRCLTDHAVKRKQPSRNFVGRKSKDSYKKSQKIRHKRWHLKKKYGITDVDFFRMVEEQGGHCLLCPRPATATDHCHVTGKVRGILCHGCNSGLGYFYENVETLRNAIAYLEKHNADRKVQRSS